MSQQEQQIQIRATDDKLKGDYTNVMRVSHNREEFVLDFLSVIPPTGVLCSRVLVSPRHFKRMVRTMQENLKNYEENFGPLEQADESETRRFGFEYHEKR